ncbi:MAG: tetratricopeptide repeat protein [Spirochaetales bacterium]|nr:tetratricopeptide repeat protein [Spirochaetales bacterium]
MSDFPDAVHAKIEALCEKGDVLVENSKFDKALEQYEKALQLVPDPKTDYEAATWIYAALGDTYFFMQKYDAAKNSFYDALNCFQGQGNPFIHLRLGQRLFELNDPVNAADQLMRAFMAEGPEIFMEDDPKYLTFLKSQIDAETENK